MYIGYKWTQLQHPTALNLDHRCHCQSATATSCLPLEGRTERVSASRHRAVRVLQEPGVKVQQEVLDTGFPERKSDSLPNFASLVKRADVHALQDLLHTVINPEQGSLVTGPEEREVDFVGDQVAWSSQRWENGHSQRDAHVANSSSTTCTGDLCNNVVAVASPTWQIAGVTSKCNTAPENAVHMTNFAADHRLLNGAASWQEQSELGPETSKNSSLHNPTILQLVGNLDSRPTTSAQEISDLHSPSARQPAARAYSGDSALVVQSYRLSRGLLKSPDRWAPATPARSRRRGSCRTRSPHSHVDPYEDGPSTSSHSTVSYTDATRPHSKRAVPPNKQLRNVLAQQSTVQPAARNNHTAQRSTQAQSEWDCAPLAKLHDQHSPAASLQQCSDELFTSDTSPSPHPNLHRPIWPGYHSSLHPYPSHSQMQSQHADPVPIPSGPHQDENSTEHAQRGTPDVQTRIRPQQSTSLHLASVHPWLENISSTAPGASAEPEELHPLLPGVRYTPFGTAADSRKLQSSTGRWRRQQSHQQAVTHTAASSTASHLSSPHATTLPTATAAAPTPSTHQQQPVTRSAACCTATQHALDLQHRHSPSILPATACTGNTHSSSQQQDHDASSPPAAACTANTHSNSQQQDHEPPSLPPGSPETPVVRISKATKVHSAAASVIAVLLAQPEVALLAAGQLSTWVALRALAEASRSVRRRTHNTVVVQPSVVPNLRPDVYGNGTVFRLHASCRTAPHLTQTMAERGAAPGSKLGSPVLANTTAEAGGVATASGSSCAAHGAVAESVTQVSAAGRGAAQGSELGSAVPADTTAAAGGAATAAGSSCAAHGAVAESVAHVSAAVCASPSSSGCEASTPGGAGTASSSSSSIETAAAPSVGISARSAGAADTQPSSPRTAVGWTDPVGYHPPEPSYHKVWSNPLKMSLWLRRELQAQGTVLLGVRTPKDAAVALEAAALVAEQIRRLGSELEVHADQPPHVPGPGKPVAVQLLLVVADPTTAAA